MMRLYAKWTIAKIMKGRRIIKARDMESADVLGMMDLIMRASGKKAWDTVSVYLYKLKLMEIKLNIEDSGRVTNGMEKGDWLFQIRQ